MIDTIGSDLGSFRKNLDAFEKDGHISKPQRVALEKVVELGHAVTHRAHAPTKPQVLAALDVTEAIVSSIDVDPDAIKKVLKDLPPRRK
jgi:hypothetical protein